MTEEKLKEINNIRKLLKEDIAVLSNIDNSKRSQICDALYILLHTDDKFKIAFDNAVNEVKSRLEKEFNEL